MEQKKALNEHWKWRENKLYFHTYSMQTKRMELQNWRLCFVMHIAHLQSCHVIINETKQTVTDYKEQKCTQKRMIQNRQDNNNNNKI